MSKFTWDGSDQISWMGPADDREEEVTSTESAGRYTDHGRKQTPSSDDEIEDDLEDDLGDGEEDVTEAFKTYWTLGNGRSAWVGRVLPETALYQELRRRLPEERARRTAAQWYRDIFGRDHGQD